jgi:hypothetical protein
LEEGNTKVMLLNSKVGKPRDLPTLAELTTCEDALLQNHNHLSMLAFEVIVELQNQASILFPFIQVVSFEFHRTCS